MDCANVAAFVLGILVGGVLGACITAIFMILFSVKDD